MGPRLRGDDSNIARAGQTHDAGTRPNAALAIDPITLEVIRHGLVSITNQIDANIKRTAFSPYIYEYNDFAVGLVGAEGQLVAQCTGGMPPFVADSVGMAVRDGLAIYGQRAAAPRRRGALQSRRRAGPAPQQHRDVHADLCRAASARTLIGFFAINVHWIEIGGIQTNSTDIFMEGLQLRSIKLWSKGEPIEEVYRIIENNTRMPQRADGRHRGAARRLPARPRPHRASWPTSTASPTFNRAVELILDQSEAAARAFIRAMPDGVYRTETYLDNDRSGGDEPVPIIVKVIVEGDELTVDYTEHRRAGRRGRSIPAISAAVRPSRASRSSI